MNLRLGQWLGIFLIVCSLSLVIYKIFQAESSVVFYTLEEVFEKQSILEGSTIRVSGMVEHLHSEFKEGTVVEFELGGVGTKKLSVTYRGIPPDLFKSHQGVIVEGKLNGDHLQAFKLIVKHSEVYDTKADHQELKTKKLLESMNLGQESNRP